MGDADDGVTGPLDGLAILGRRRGSIVLVPPYILLQLEHTAHDDLSRGARRRQRVNGDGELGIS